MNSNKILYIERLRCIAAFAVLFLHVVCTPFLICYDSYSAFELFVARALGSFASFGVPVFVMISGALLVNPEKSLPLKKLFFKYIRRFVLVIAVFGTLFSLMELVFSSRKFSLEIFFRAVLNTVKARSWDHTWYLYMTIGLYALLPLFRGFARAVESLPKKDGKNILLCVLLSMFFISSAVPYAGFFVDFSNFLPEISVYLFYLLLGYSVEKWNFALPNKISVLLILFYALYICLIQLNSAFVKNGDAALLTLGNNSPVVVFAALSIFSLCRNLSQKKSGEENQKINSKISDFLSPLTFGIYIIHAVPINFCYKVLNLTPENFPFSFSLILTLIITTVFSVFGAWILRKIPPVKKYLL